MTQWVKKKIIGGFYMLFSKEFYRICPFGYVVMIQICFQTILFWKLWSGSKKLWWGEKLKDDLRRSTLPTRHTFFIFIVIVYVFFKAFRHYERPVWNDSDQWKASITWPVYTATPYTYSVFSSWVPLMAIFSRPRDPIMGSPSRLCPGVNIVPVMIIWQRIFAPTNSKGCAPWIKKDWSK